MPNKYKRKAVAIRGNWSEESLKAAIIALKNAEMSVYAAAKMYQIPRKTLERRFKQNNDKKGPMGPSSLFGKENENKLANHIKSMQAKGFPLTIDDVRKIAYQLAEQLHLKHRFNKETEKAGYDFVKLFLGRHPDITIRKSEGVSLARSNAMNRREVDAYFNLLENVLMVDDVMMKPSHIFNMDETGLQLNNRPDHVLAAKGSKAVSTVTSTEKGETITVIACCNAEGTFLPPACIMKGKNKKPEFEDGMPPGSKVFMSPKSAYITSAIFLEWMKTHFVQRKPAGKVLLLLDGHSTHCNSVEMLEYAEQNDIVLLSMPSHTSHYLQPLDRAVFKSLKTHFYEQCRLWLKQNSGRRITRLTFGSLLNKAWGKAACAENAIAGFKATGVCPYNPSAVPDYAFTLESVENTSLSRNDTPATTTVQVASGTITSVSPNHERDKVAGASVGPDRELVTDNESSSSVEEHRMLNVSPEILPKKRPRNALIQTGVNIAAMLPSTSATPRKEKCDNIPDLTPTRILNEISPVPQKLTQVRKRAKQIGTILTSAEHINIRKCKEDAKNVKELQIAKKLKRENKTDLKLNKTENIKKENKSNKKEKKIEKETIKKNVPRKRKSLRRLSDSSDDDEELVLCDVSDEERGGEENICVGCSENYYETLLVEDWLQCNICKLWVHENCTEFDDMCSKCGKKMKHDLKNKRCLVKKE